MKERPRRRPTPAHELAGFLLPIADAPDYAHRRGIIHQDAKPANILVERDRGVDWLYPADFGLAKAFAGDGTAITRSGVGAGTPGYIPPGQARAQIGPPGDLYALGVIAYEMLTGHVPYRGGTLVEVALKHLTEPLPPLRESNPILRPFAAGWDGASGRQPAAVALSMISSTTACWGVMRCPAASARKWLISASHAGVSGTGETFASVRSTIAVVSKSGSW